MSLKTKYIILATGILALVLGIFEYRHLLNNQTEIYQNARARSTLTAEIIKNSITSTMLKGNSGVTQNFLQSLVAEDLKAVRLVKPDGTIKYSSAPKEIGTRIKVPEMGEPPRPVFQPSRAAGGLVKSLFVPIYNEKPCQRCHADAPRILSLLSVEMSNEKAIARLKRMKMTSALMFIVTLAVLSVSLGIMTTSLVTRPIKAIIDTMRKVREGDLRVRFLTSRKDEIGELADSLHSMLFELHKTRQELEQCHVSDLQKVEKMATVGELAAAIAHDIKNPLAGISGAIQVFAEDFPEDDYRRDIIKEVLFEIERLDRSVKDLLNYARPPRPNIIRTPIVPIVERVALLLKPQAGKHGIDIEISETDDVDEMHLDPDQIQQVFLNIMLNAIQAMPDGGKLIVTTSLIPNTDMVEIAFRDTGTGIPAESLPDIFKPFFTTKHAGTGLGLAICKNTVERHGGKLLVKSRMGVGTTFKVLLPKEARYVES